MNNNVFLKHTFRLGLNTLKEWTFELSIHTSKFHAMLPNVTAYQYKQIFPKLSEL